MMFINISKLISSMYCCLVFSHRMHRKLCFCDDFILVIMQNIYLNGKPVNMYIYDVQNVKTRIRL